MEHWWTLNK